jgi:Tol biopolymer transport system component
MIFFRRERVPKTNTTSMKIFISFLFLLGSFSTFSQAGSEILLFDLHVKKGRLILFNPKNVTNHIGYDNQPSFHSGKPLIYYSSFNEEGRSEIKVYNYKSGETTQLTQTQEREYSPTLTPDKQFISCIIQRDSGAQDLGKYPATGGQPIVLIDNLIVGYHAWVDNDRLLLFVLGEPQTLHLYNVKTKEDKILTEKIGRSLHKIPDQNAMSFVHKISDTEWVIKKFDIATLTISTIINALPNREDLCWTADGRILMSDGTKIYSVKPNKEKEWSELQIKSGNELLKGVTRLAINREGNKLAVVVAE